MAHTALVMARHSMDETNAGEYFGSCFFGTQMEWMTTVIISFQIKWFAIPRWWIYRWVGVFRWLVDIKISFTQWRIYVDWVMSPFGQKQSTPYEKLRKHGLPLPCVEASVNSRLCVLERKHTSGGGGGFDAF